MAQQNSKQDPYADKIIYDESGLFGWWRGSLSKEQIDDIQDMYASWKETPDAWKILNIVRIIRADYFVQYVLLYAEGVRKYTVGLPSADDTYSALVSFFRQIPDAEMCIVKGRYRSLIDFTIPTNEALAGVWVDIEAVSCGLCEISENYKWILPPNIRRTVDSLRELYDKQQQTDLADKGKDYGKGKAKITEEQDNTVTLKDIVCLESARGWPKVSDESIRAELKKRGVAPIQTKPKLRYRLKEVEQAMEEYTQDYKQLHQ